MSMEEWLDSPAQARRERRWFFVAEAARQPYHVESRENCEVMLCGKVIPVDGPAVIQSWWGPKKCPDCFILFGKLEGKLP